MNKIIIILCLSATVLHSQNKGIITLPVGEGAGGDSLGNVIPDTRVLLGQGTNLATSTDSLVWDAGFEVTGPVRFLALPNLTESAGDSLLMINNLGTVFKTSTNVNNFVSADLTGVANRTHDFENYNLSIIDVGTLFLESDVLFNVKTTSNLNSVSGWDGVGLTLKGEDIYLNSTDIILQNALTINNNWDTILVRNPLTGEIQGRDASSFSGGSADSLGTNVTAGRLVFGLGNKTPGNSANLFWDNSSSELAIGHTSPSGDLHVISTDPTNRSSLIGQNDNSATAFTSTFPALSLRNNNTTANNYVRMNFQDASSTAAAAIASQITDHTSDYGTLEFWTRSSGGFSQKLMISDVGNIGIGTATFGTSAAGVIAIANGTAPSTSPANAVQLYVEDVSSSAELKVRDEAGNVRVLSDGLTYASNALSVNTSIVTANTWYDGPSVSLDAGTWLVTCHLTFVKATTTAVRWFARITDGTNHHASGTTYISSNASNTATITLTAIITLASTTTIKGQGTVSTSTSTTINAALPANGSGNNASIITAVRLD